MQWPPTWSGTVRSPGVHRIAIGRRTCASEHGHEIACPARTGGSASSADGASLESRNHAPVFRQGEIDVEARMPTARPCRSALPLRLAAPPCRSASPLRLAAPPRRSASPLRLAAPPRRSASPLRLAAPPRRSASPLRLAAPPCRSALPLRLAAPPCRSALPPAHPPRARFRRPWKCPETRGAHAVDDVTGRKQISRHAARARLPRTTRMKLS